MNDILDRDCIAWCISDGLNETWLYPEDIQYISDGLKSLRSRYTDLAVRLLNSSMLNSANRIKLRVENINSLIKLLGGDPNDNSFADSSL